MLAVEGLSKRFGGFLAVNQVSFEVRAGRDSRPHRAERLGQEHDVQSDRRQAAPERAARSASTAKEIGGLPAHTHLPSRHRAHVPDSAAFPQTVAARERDARRLLRRRPARISRARSARSRAEEALGLVGLPTDAAAHDRRAWRRRAQEARARARARHQAEAAAGRRKPRRPRFDRDGARRRSARQHPQPHGHHHRLGRAHHGRADAHRRPRHRARSRRKDLRGRCPRRRRSIRASPRSISARARA